MKKIEKSRLKKTKLFKIPGHLMITRVLIISNDWWFIISSENQFFEKENVKEGRKE
jgi:hypothetical protein